MDEIREFITELRFEGRMSENTIRSYQTDLKKLKDFADGIGKEDIVRLTEKELKTYIESLAQRHYSPATLARNIVSVKALFKHLYKKEQIKIDIAENLTAPRVELPKITVLTRKQIEMLMATPDTKSAKGQRDAAMLELMYATGIKVSELITAKISDLDMQIGCIECRSDKKDRIIPFDKKARKALTRYLQDGRRHLIKKSSEELIFVNYQGEALSRQGVWKTVKKYAEEAGIKTQITPEILRHSFAAHMVERGADIEAVKEMMGHISLATTGRYARENRDYIRDVYNQTH